MVTEDGLTVPAPFSVIVIVPALLNVLPLMVTGCSPQVLPLLADNVSVGGLGQPQATVNGAPVLVHPAALRTVMA